MFVSPPHLTSNPCVGALTFSAMANLLCDVVRVGQGYESGAPHPPTDGVSALTGEEGTPGLSLSHAVRKSHVSTREEGAGCEPGAGPQ